MFGSKKPSARLNTSSGPKPVSQNRMPRRCITSVAAAATPKMPPLAPPVSACGRRDERAGRAAEHRHEVDRREADRAGPRLEGLADDPEHEHVEAEVHDPEVHGGVGEEAPPLAVAAARPGRARGWSTSWPLPLIVASRRKMQHEERDVEADEQLRRDQRVALDRLADPHRALRPVGADALEALRSDRGLGQAVGARGPSAAGAGAARFPVVMVEAGRPWRIPTVPAGLVRNMSQQLRCSPWRTRRRTREVPGASSSGPHRTGPDGLSAAEVADREQRGLVNRADERTSRSLVEIARANLLTRFNAILGTMFVLILVFGDAQDGLFGFVLVINALIGIVQEWRAKRTLDRLAVLSAPRARVVRDGEVREIDVSDVVLDDLLEIRAGDQLVADGIVVRRRRARDRRVAAHRRVGADEQGRRRARCCRAASSVAGSGRFQATSVGRRRVRAPARDRGAPVHARAVGARRRDEPHPAARAVGDRPDRDPARLQPVRGDRLDARGDRRRDRGHGRDDSRGSRAADEPRVRASRRSRSRGSACWCRSCPRSRGLARVDVVVLDKTGTITEGVMRFDDARGARRTTTWLPTRSARSRPTRTATPRCRRCAKRSRRRRDGRARRRCRSRRRASGARRRSATTAPGCSARRRWCGSGGPPTIRCASASKSSRPKGRRVLLLARTDVGARRRDAARSRSRRRRS